MMQAMDGTTIMVQPIPDKMMKHKTLAELLQYEAEHSMAYLIYPDELPWDQTIGRNEVLFGTMFSALDFRLMQASDISSRIQGKTVTAIVEQEACDAHNVRVGDMDVFNAAMHAFSYDDTGVSLLCQYQNNHYKIPIRLSPNEKELVRQIVLQLD